MNCSPTNVVQEDPDEVFVVKLPNQRTQSWAFRQPDAQSWKTCKYYIWKSIFHVQLYNGLTPLSPKMIFIQKAWTVFYLKSHDEWIKEKYVTCYKFPKTISQNKIRWKLSGKMLWIDGFKNKMIRKMFKKTWFRKPNHTSTTALGLSPKQLNKKTLRR